MKNKIISIFLISTILASLSFTGCGKENNISKEDKVSIDKLFNHQKEIFSKDYLNNHQVNITGNMDLSIQSDLFALYAGMASEENSEIEFDTSEENSKMIIDMKLNAEMTSKYSHESNTTTTTICGVSETSDSQMYYDDEKLIRYTFDEDINGWTYSKEDETFLETFSFGAINELSLTGNDKNSSKENNKESKDQLTDFLSALKKEYKNSDIKVDNDGKSYIIDKKINLVDFIGEDDKLDDLTGYADLVLKFDKDDYDLNYIKLNLNEEAKTVIDKYLSSYGIHFESMNIQLNLDWQDKGMQG